ncbi:MAG TPA: ImmA/IrrE family metallo-endopeptidase [Pseudogracilibacillus sp.]|nr:ImmA/IrrE family metallo-endopeptidase [Pseudogracilibacillus sp.]
MPKQSAVKLIKKYHSNDPFYIAECLGVQVLYESLGGIYGYYNYYKRIKMIHINESLDEKMQRFTCAHELGHALLHHDVNTTFLKKNTFFSTSKIEREANTFAVELLMPDEYLYELRDTNLSIYEAAKMYGVPKEVCRLKEI